MSWTIAGKYVRASATDPDAQAYLQAVEAADGQALEFEVARAIDNFVLGCKADGIWDAIKASCIMAGARTLAGALQPLVGTAPTNFNFVSEDYSRKTGLVGNGSTKYLDSNRNNNADPQNSQHLAVYLSSRNSTNRIHIGAGGTAIGASGIGVSVSSFTAFQRSRTASAAISGTLSVGFYGKTRNASNFYSNRCNSTSNSVTVTSEAPASGSLFIYARENGSGVAELFLGDRLAFYSIGESLDLALLDARVTDLINAFAAAIPS
jgi:hypothetical protein